MTLWVCVGSTFQNEGFLLSFIFNTLVLFYCTTFSARLSAAWIAWFPPLSWNSAIGYLTGRKVLNSDPRLRGFCFIDNAELLCSTNELLTSPSRYPHKMFGRGFALFDYGCNGSWCISFCLAKKTRWQLFENWSVQINVKLVKWLGWWWF
jgi:hypothetical protein